MNKEIELVSSEKIKINKWKIRVGSQISNGNIILLYEDPDDCYKTIKRFKSNRCGVVTNRLYKEGDIVDAGYIEFNYLLPLEFIQLLN